MISTEETITLSPYSGIYDLVVPKVNILRQINELLDFSFILNELKTKYCLDNGRNAISLRGKTFLHSNNLYENSLIK